MGYLSFVLGLALLASLHAPSLQCWPPHTALSSSSGSSTGSSSGSRTGSSHDQCGSTVASLARQVRDHGRIRLQGSHTSGVGDNADAASNIRDTAAGRRAHRSSYGTAPGGTVCLEANVLRYLLNIANAGYSLQVNELAGGSHSSTSRHYQGSAVDLQATGSYDYAYYLRECESMGAAEHYGPGDRGHDRHVHCSF